MKKITMILAMLIFISILNLNSENFLASGKYIIDENQSIDEDFIVEGDVKITGGAVVSFSNCNVDIFGQLTVDGDSKVLFKNCKIGESEYQYPRFISINNAQLTLDNCIVNVDVRFDLEAKTKVIIENSNIDGLWIDVSNITIENLNQGFISKYNLKNNNSELIISDSTVEHIDLYVIRNTKIQNVSCRGLYIPISEDEKEDNTEISNSEIEYMNIQPIVGTINIDKIKQGFNNEAEVYSENMKFHLKIIESEISSWILQTTLDPIVNIGNSIITTLVLGGNSVINFVRSETPNEILDSLICQEDAINPTIKGFVSIADDVKIDMSGATMKGFILTRYFPVFIKYENKPLENISVKILENGEEIWSGRTDTEGYVEPTIVFNEDNINDEFKIKLEYDGLSYSDDISLKTSTPLIFDEQVLVPEFGQVKDNKILIYGSSVVIVFIIALILLYYLKKKK